MGIYGTMTQQGTHNVMATMAAHTGLGPGSVLLDIGSGLCRCVVQAALAQSCALVRTCALRRSWCLKPSCADSRAQARPRHVVRLIGR